MIVGIRLWKDSVTAFGNIAQVEENLMQEDSACLVLLLLGCVSLLFLLLSPNRFLFCAVFSFFFSLFLTVA
jgi:hypothetical protein